jgi:hypothetical protein
VRFGADGDIVGITSSMRGQLLDRNELVITVPHAVDVRRDELEFALH